MPRPPNPDSFSQINFITNFALVGCAPNDWAFIEFAQEPANDLAFLILFPDLQDIGQAIFDPYKGRKRKPGRHGRKNRRGFQFPDTSDQIGMRARGFINPANIFRYSPVRYAFPVLNFVEGITFSVAIIEGLTELVFDGLIGVISVDRNNCSELDRIQRSRDTQGTFGGAGQPIAPISLPTLDYNLNFLSSNFNVKNDNKPYTVAFNATLTATQDRNDWEASLALGTSSNDKRAQSRITPMFGQQTKRLDVAADFQAGENCVFGIGDRKGFYHVSDAQLFAYSTADFPWPW